MSKSIGGGQFREMSRKEFCGEFGYRGYRAKLFFYEASQLYVGGVYEPGDVVLTFSGKSLNEACGLFHRLVDVELGGPLKSPAKLEDE
jgi:hypothetical protein